MARQSSQRCKCRQELHRYIELPYDEQVELSENTGVPIINEYHKVKLFGGNYKKAFMELVDIILTDNEE